MAAPQLPSAGGSFALPGPLSQLNRYLAPVSRNPDIALAVGILLVLGLMILPLPAFLLDFLLTISITISVLILMVSVYLREPLELSSFPTILLMSTLFRLGLNISSTRLILSEAHAGEIIKAFGSFVVGGNFVVGVIIFIILVVVNFVVIIKGSTRIAEVTARFTLDAMPGKQMSIDADLNAGFIDEKEARARRLKLTRESEFNGAMDGAAKFVKGDAVAGLIITAINIVGGFIIGIAQKDMSAADAASTYTILTIGEGLVSQIPALLISVAAGLVVTRGASGVSLESELGEQFGSKPRALYVVSGALLTLGILPGFPMFPFLLLGGTTGMIAFVRTKTIAQENDDKLKEELAAAAPAAPVKPEDQPVEELLKIDPVEVELGYGLISLVDESQGGDVFKRISNIRRQLASELGIILPPVRVRDNLQLDPEEYVVKIRSNEIARNRLYPAMLLAMNPGTAEGDLHGIKVTEPVFGLPATWITVQEREHAEIMGFTVVEPPTVLATHLTELLKRNSDRMLTRQDVKQLVENLKTDYPALLDEISPDSLPVGLLQKVLQNLLKEGIPVRDLPMILESLLEYGKVTKNVDVLTEYVRHNLGDTIKKLFQDQNGVIHAIAVDPYLEQTMTTALQTSHSAAGSATLGLAPDMLRSLQQSLSEAIDEVTLLGYAPVIVCSAPVRPYLYRMIHTTFPMVSVVSFTELPADTEIEIITNVRV